MNKKFLSYILSVGFCVLLTSGVKPRAVYEDAFLIACMDYDKKSIKTLFNYVKTPLQVAVQSQNVDSIQYIIQKFFNYNKDLLNDTINFSYICGKAPLHWAVIGNNAKMVSFLINNNANPNIYDNNGNTPLHLAMDKGFNNIASFLLSNGADPKIKNSCGKTALNFSDILIKEDKKSLFFNKHPY